VQIAKAGGFEIKTIGTERKTAELKISLGVRLGSEGSSGGDVRGTDSSARDDCTLLILHGSCNGSGDNALTHHAGRAKLQQEDKNDPQPNQIPEIYAIAGRRADLKKPH
jgi:hypothetical protein